MGSADAIQNSRYQYYSDKLKAQFRYRWIATCVLACFYAIRVYLEGCLATTFFLGICLTILVCELLTSTIDPNNPYRISPPDDIHFLLPIYASDELRPFAPLMPEFTFWKAVNFVLCVALGMTFIPINNIFPRESWYILLGVWLIYSILILFQHKKMMRDHKYIPFYYGDKKQGEYKGK